MRKLAGMTGVFKHGRPVIAGVLAASLGVCACGSGSPATTAAAPTAASTPAAAAPPASAVLVLRAGTLPGFSAYGPPQEATTAPRWAAISNERDEVESEIKRLTRAGFQEGVGQHYKAPGGRGAISVALVFTSRQGAASELARYLGLDPRYGLHAEGVKVAAIPSAVVVGEGPAGDVLFTSGRCFLLVGAQLGSSANQAQVNAVTIPGATALYGCVKRLCA